MSLDSPLNDPFTDEGAAAKKDIRARRIATRAVAALAAVCVVGALAASVAVWSGSVTLPQGSISLASVTEGQDSDVTFTIAPMEGAEAAALRAEAVSEWRRRVAVKEALPLATTAGGVRGLVGAVDPTVVVNLAEKAWQFMRDNAAVVDLKSHYATAVPKGLDTLEDLTGWSDPVVHGPYVMKAKNKFDSTVAHVEYSIVFQHSGSYEGKGAYLHHLGIIVHKTDVQWSNKLEAEVVTDHPTNVGDAEGPIAGMPIDLKFMVETWTAKSVAQHSFFARGDGDFKVVSMPDPDPDDE